MPEHDTLSMVVLAGGESRRMGRDKANLTLAGRTFLEIQIEKGRRLGICDIMVSGYRGASCGTPTIPDVPIKLNIADYQDVQAASNIRIIPDRTPGQGPLGGLSTCFRFARHDRCLVLGVDIPLIPQEELSNLITYSASIHAPAVILKHGEREEPLVGIYCSTLAPVMEKALEEGSGSVFHFLRQTGYDTYSSTAPEHFFSNINDMETYLQITSQGVGTTLI